MADLTVTISNAVVCVGPDPSRWGAFVWGVDPWGNGIDLATDFSKAWSDSQALSDQVSLEATFNISLNDSISSTFEMSNEGLRDAAGYSYVFTRPTTDAETRSLTTYTTPSGATTSWTSGLEPTTSWSES